MAGKSNNREVVVALDHFAVVGREAVLCADLDSSLAVIVMDPGREMAALLHLRFLADANIDVDATDTTLASDLLLLDRLLTRARKSAPMGTPLLARIAASALGSRGGRQASETVLNLVRAFLQDAGVQIESEDVRKGGEFRLQFRPLSGALTLTSPTAVSKNASS